MDSIINFLLSYLLLYKYFTLFVIMFLSGMILPIPINTLFLAVGAFCSQGYFNIYISGAVALSGNVLGDITDYFLARKYGTRLVLKLNLKESKYYEMLEGYIKRYARSTIFFSRFLGTPGTIVNILSPLADISPSFFIFYDIVGNFFDVSIFLVLGYFLGGLWEGFSDLLSILGFIVVVAFLLYILIAVYIQKRKAPKSDL